MAVSHNRNAILLRLLDSGRTALHSRGKVPDFEFRDCASILALCFPVSHLPTNYFEIRTFFGFY